MEWHYVVLGLLAGVLVGLSGVGGGSLVTPALTFFGISPAVAVGTDLVFAAVTKGFGAAVHRAQRSVDWRAAGLLAAGSCPAAALTVLFLAVSGAHAGGRLISVMLSIALILTAVSLCVDRERVARAALRAGGRLRRYRVPITVAAGAGLGALVTLSSIGAGALGAVFLVMLYPRLSALRIAGTDIAHAVPLTLVAGAGHLWLGTVDGVLLMSLLAGSVPGIVAASLVAGRLPERAVRSFLALVLFAVGTRFGVSAALAAPAPRAVPTFHSLGLYWAPPGGSASQRAQVEFREAGSIAWRRGLDLWFDARNAEYRGSLVELKPGTQYEIRLALASGSAQLLQARTWSERLPVKRTIEIAPGTARLVIEASDSGNEKDGYVVFTAPPGRNVIDQSALEGNGPRASCVVVKQGVHHVIIRGLVLRNCKRHGVLIERQSEPVLEAQTRDIVIEDNEIVGWGGARAGKDATTLALNDGAIHCNYWHETQDAKRPDRIIIQRNTIHDPRHGANPWRSAAGRRHPIGPQGVAFERCGSNHVIRYNDIYSRNGNYYNDGIGGGDNFSDAGFPWADADIYGNRVSEAYDDGIEAEGGNRNVRIWGNYLDRVFVGIGNAATAVGPLYVWRNVSHRMANMYQPDADPDREDRGPFIKAGSRRPAANGGRAYYFHNTVLQPPAAKYGGGAGWGINNSGGPLYNFVSRNNIWHIHKEPRIHGEPKFASLDADAGKGPIDADFDLHNGQLAGLGPNAERRGWGPGAAGRPRYASSGTAYPDLAAQPGNFALKPGSPGYRGAEVLPNFNDRYPQPDVGAHQSGTPPMRFGAAAHL